MSNHSSSIPELSDNGIRYYQTYNESLSLWPVRCKSFYISTRFGQTHVIASGPEDARRLYYSTEHYSARRCGIPTSPIGAVNTELMQLIS